MTIRIKILIAVLAIIFLYFNYHNLIGTYPIKEVKLKGEFVYVDEDKLYQKQNLFNGKDLMHVDLIDIKKNIEKNDWIKSSLIERQFPDTLAIELFEYKPFLLWNEESFIDNEGKKFVVEKTISIDLPSIKSNTISYEKMYSLYIELSNLLNKIDLKILSIAHAGDMLKIRTDKYKFLVRYSDSSQKFDEFINVYEQFRDTSKKNIKTIDLRYSTGFAVH